MDEGEEMEVESDDEEEEEEEDGEEVQRVRAPADIEMVCTYVSIASLLSS